MIDWPFTIGIIGVSSIIGGVVVNIFGGKLPRENEKKIIELEANYKNIKESLNRIERKLNNRTKI